MVYTVKKLSEISGVTVRALHYYEEAGLLQPAYYGSNGYRYYEEKELLQLQQILFFKELGLTLKQIRKILGKSDFDQIAALQTHHQALSREWERVGRLLETIDKTIKHLKGTKKMKDQEMFDGFNGALVEASKGKSFSAAEELVFRSIKNPTKSAREKAYYEEILKTAHALFEEIVRSMDQGLDSTDPLVQEIIGRHYAFLTKGHDHPREVYKAYAKLYVEHPDFRKQLDPFHPKLAEFMATGMNHFAKGSCHFE